MFTYTDNYITIYIIKIMRIPMAITLESLYTRYGCRPSQGEDVELFPARIFYETLENAARRGATEDVQSLVGMMPRRLSSQTSLQTALQTAAENAHPDTVDYALEEMRRQRIVLAESIFENAVKGASRRGNLRTLHLLFEKMPFHLSTYSARFFKTALSNHRDGNVMCELLKMMTAHDRYMSLKRDHVQEMLASNVAARGDPFEHHLLTTLLEKMDGSSLYLTPSLLKEVMTAVGISTRDDAPPKKDKSSCVVQ